MLSYNMSTVLEKFSLSMRLLPWLSLTNAANYCSSKHISGISSLFVIVISGMYSMPTHN